MTITLAKTVIVWPADELAVDAADAGGGFVVAVFDREGDLSSHRITC